MNINTPYFDFSLLLNKTEFDLLLKNGELAVQLTANKDMGKGYIVQVGKYHQRSRKLLGKYLYCKVTEIQYVTVEGENRQNALLTLTLDKELSNI